MNKLIINLWVLLIPISFVSQAQNSITISKRSPVFIDYSPSFSSGSPKNIVVDNSQWLNYSTDLQPSEPTFSITVEVAMGSVPEGLELQVEASPYKGRGSGKIGRPARKVAVTNIPRVLIDNIGSCYTGSGENEGHRIALSFIFTDYRKLRSGTTTIYVQYTITQ